MKVPSSLVPLLAKYPMTWSGSLRSSVSKSTAPSSADSPACNQFRRCSQHIRSGTFTSRCGQQRCRFTQCLRRLWWRWTAATAFGSSCNIGGACLQARFDGRLCGGLAGVGLISAARQQRLPRLRHGELECKLRETLISRHASDARHLAET